MVDLDAVLKRFWAKVSKDSDGCWRWLGAIQTNGYGAFLADGRSVLAHRWAFQQHTTGIIHDALVFDHLCRNRGCVNPSHLEPVTSRVNTLRGVSVSALNAVKTTHCKHGHDLAGANLYVRPNGKRQCRACGQAHKLRYDQKRAG